MGRETFSRDSYVAARHTYGVTEEKGVTHKAEQRSRATGKLSEIVDPAINPMRYSKIRLDPHQKKWMATVGCPMDIEVSCDTTGSMGGEVDTEMATLPDLYEAVARVLPGYDPQLCLGIFGDCCDDFVMCRPQFEMTAPKIVNYLKEMSPQRAGGDAPEDPQYAMFARAYLTDAYTNRIGLKGYHFIVTDVDCHNRLKPDEIKRIFGKDIFNNELKNMSSAVPTVEEMIKELKRKTHQFILLVDNYRETAEFWSKLCGESSVIEIDSTKNLPVAISAIIGLTEGTLEITDLEQFFGSKINNSLIEQLSKIDIGAQAKLRKDLPHPVPKAGDIFNSKEDLWPQSEETKDTEEPEKPEKDEIVYL